MNRKPWLTEDGGRQLEAFLGSRGMRTSEIKSTEQLLQTAAVVFEVRVQATCREMVDVISAMTNDERRRLAEKNIRSSRHRQRQNESGSPSVLDFFEVENDDQEQG